MSQDYSVPAGSDRMNVAVKTKVPGALAALLSLHSGDTEPATTAAFMLWVDTGATPAVLKQRNAADSGWEERCTLGGDSTQSIEASGFAGTLSASLTDYVGVLPRNATIKALVIVASNASSSSSGNEWTFQLTCYPASAPGSPVNLFSATVGTFTSLVDVGGGSDLAADTAWLLVPDQNAALDAHDVLELVATKVGAATTLNNLRVFVEYV